MSPKQIVFIQLKRNGLACISLQSFPGGRVERRWTADLIWTLVGIFFFFNDDDGASRSKCKGSEATENASAKHEAQINQERSDRVKVPE